MHFSPAGEPISEAEWNARRDEWLPSEADKAYVKSLMKPVFEPGKMANWIAPPKQGIKGRPVDFEYVRRA
jgi:benzoyl-CoA 2,3-dioxygenase component B